MSVIQTSNRFELKVDSLTFSRLPIGKNTNSNDVISSNFISVKQLINNPKEEAINSNPQLPNPSINTDNFDLSTDFQKFSTHIPQNINRELRGNQQMKQSDLIFQTSLRNMPSQNFLSPSEKSIKHILKPKSPGAAPYTKFQDPTHSSRLEQLVNDPFDNSEENHNQNKPRIVKNNAPSQFISKQPQKFQTNLNYNQNIQNDEEGEQYVINNEIGSEKGNYEINQQQFKTEISKPKFNKNIDLLEELTVGANMGLTNDIFQSPEDNTIFTASLLKPETKEIVKKNKNSQGFEKFYQESLAKENNQNQPSLLLLENSNSLFGNENSNSQYKPQKDLTNEDLLNALTNAKNNQENIIQENYPEKAQIKSNNKQTTWQDEMFDLVSNKMNVEEEKEKKPTKTPLKNSPLLDLQKNSYPPINNQSNLFNTMSGFPPASNMMNIGMSPQLMNQNMMMMYMTNLMNMNNMMMSGMRPQMMPPGGKQ